MYSCKQCGCCCRRVGTTIWGRGLALPDGSCKYLDIQTHLCRIYEHRPIFCRVDESYERYFQNQLSREEFYRQNMKICRELQEQEKAGK